MDRYYVSLNERGYIIDTQDENTILKIFQFMNVKTAIISPTEGNNTPAQRGVAVIPGDTSNFFP